jgi:hypothetical protein
LHDVSSLTEQKRRRIELYELAAEQEAVVSIEQLRALGYTTGQIYGMVARGELIRLGRGVYLVGRCTVPPRGHLFAAQLAMGPASFLSFYGAAMAYDLQPVRPKEIEITVPGCPRPRKGLIVHGTRARDALDVCEYHGLRVSTIPRMLIDLASREAPADLERLVTESIHKGLFDFEPTRAAFERYGRRPGSAVAARALSEYVWVPQDKSGLERAFARWLGGETGIPAPERNVRLGPYEIDVYWPPPIAHAVELDGRRYHEAIRDRNRDNAKDIWLQKRGITIQRISDYAFNQRKPQILADLRDFVALRRAA